MTRWYLTDEMDNDVYFDGYAAPAHSTEQIEATRQAISTAYAEFYGVLKAEIAAIPLPHQEKRWLDPDQNGLEDILANIMSVLDQAGDNA